MSTVGIIVKSRFILPSAEAKQTSAQNYNNYVNYIDREEATKTKEDEEKEMFDRYQDYMGNDKKASGIFTKDHDHLSEKQLKAVKELYKGAQDNNSVMWQDVISFDNDWLEQNGIYDKKTDTLDDHKLMTAVRSGVHTMLEKEEMSHAVWTGAIHRNTDNIHVHIATVEPVPTRERGKRKQSSLDGMKSKVASKVMDRSLERERITDFVRNKIVKQKEEKSLVNDRQIKKQFREVLDELPSNKRYWQYGYKHLDDVRPKIDAISKRYLEKHHGKDMKELNTLLDKEIKVMKGTYGKDDSKRYDDYKQARMDDLYKRLGNAVLKEMKEVSKNEKSKGGSKNGTPQEPFRGGYNASGETNRKPQTSTSGTNASATDSENGASRPPSEKQTNQQNSEHKPSAWQQRLKEAQDKRASRQMLVHMRKLNRYMDTSYDSWKNQNEYERINNFDRDM